MPISLDDPYELDESFITNLYMDMYGRKFMPGKSAIWHGEHINEDPSEPQVAILLETINGVIDAPRPADHATVEILGRYPVSWATPHSASFIQMLNNPIDQTTTPPLHMSTHEYSDALVARYNLADGTTRLVVGFTTTINVTISAPSSYAAEFQAECFWPMKRFFAEGQAHTCAAAFASDDSLAPLYNLDPQFVITTNDPCAHHTDPIDAALCYCLENLHTQFVFALDDCAFPPGGFTSALQGGGAGFAVGVVGGGLFSKFVKRINGAIGAGVAVGTTIAGAAAGYEYEKRACRTRARSAYNRDWNIAHTNANQARSQGTPFVCPTGNQ